MNNDDLIQAIKKLIEPQPQPLGTYSLVRSNLAGIHCGRITERQGDMVEFAPGSVRIWEWNQDGVETCTDIAIGGLSADAKNRVSPPAPGIVRIFNVFEELEMTDIAWERVQGAGWYDE